MKCPEICVVIPCHNEAACIGAVLNELHRQLPEAVLVVVDDASTDDTAALARVTGLATVLRLPTNLGIGGAVQTGLRYAGDNGFAVAVKVDGDGQHPASEIPALLRPIREGRADFTIGSRFLDGGDGFRSTFLRRIGIRLFRALNSALVGQRITDNTSGFRGYGRRALEFAAANYPAFDYPEPEEVVLMGRNGMRIVEVSTPMRERQGGRSSINLRRSVYYMIKVIFAILMAAARPRKMQKETAR